jgi:hypothetical protein
VRLYGSLARGAAGAHDLADAPAALPRSIDRDGIDLFEAAGPNGGVP